MTTWLSSHVVGAETGFAKADGSAGEWQGQVSKPGLTLSPGTEA